ncbi:hypothetical protein [Cellulomonas sp.]|uniref:hypothetical protein n=1 Tax=Cellulomonas sp. TaxID=40001 RepID=UPI003BAA1FD0
MSQDLDPDDLWVSRLRRRADEVTPDIPADAEHARRIGRRRRTVRRTSIVGGTATVVVAVALGAAPTVRLVEDHSRPAQPVPTLTASPLVATPEQLATRERDLARKAVQNGIVDPPEVAVVRWVTRSEHVFVMADCLIAAGWPITNVSAAGYDVAYASDRETEMTLDDYVCDAQYPVGGP